MEHESFGGLEYTWKISEIGWDARHTSDCVVFWQRRLEIQLQRLRFSVLPALKFTHKDHNSKCRQGSAEGLGA